MTGTKAAVSVDTLSDFDAVALFDNQDYFCTFAENMNYEYFFLGL